MNPPKLFFEAQQLVKDIPECNAAFDAEDNLVYLEYKKVMFIVTNREDLVKTVDAFQDRTEQEDVYISESVNANRLHYLRKKVKSLKTQITTLQLDLEDAEEEIKQCLYYLGAAHSHME